MVGTDLVECARQALLSGLVVAAPILLVAFAVGMATGLLQAATGIHETVVGLVPRVLAVGAALVLAFPWMVERMVELIRSGAGIP
jgi:flagellar biosynthetic protein FliQ